MFLDADDEDEDDEEDEDEEDDYLSINVDSKDDKDMSNMPCSLSTMTPEDMGMLHQKIIFALS